MQYQYKLKLAQASLAGFGVNVTVLFCGVYLVSSARTVPFVAALTAVTAQRIAIGVAVILVIVTSP